MKIHIVKQGDSLYSIAQKYGVSLEDVLKANPGISNPDVIDVGTKVKIPTPPKTALGVIHQHIVQQGDTLWKLSKAWGIQLTDLIKANPQLKNPNALLTGEVVNIPQASSPGDGTTATMHGKAHAGVVSGEGTGKGKAHTGVKAQETAPAPVVITPEETPAPISAPAEVVPKPETKPIYGIEVHEQIEYIHYPVKIGGEQAEQPKPHHGYGMEHQGYGMEHQGYGMPHHGSGMEHQGYGMPHQGYEMEHHGYGKPYPGVGAHQGHPDQSYGNAQPGVGGAEWQGGYGSPSAISPLAGGVPMDWSGLYGQQDISFSPPDAAQIHGSMTGGSMSGCKSCGAKSTLPGNVYAAEAYANAAGFHEIPYGPTPFVAGAQAQAPSATSPLPGGYGANPGMASPMSSGYGPNPGMASPMSGGFPGVHPGYGYGAQMGELPVAYTPMAEGLAGMPGGASAAPVYPGYVGDFPAIPPMPGFPAIPPMPPMPPLRDDINEQRSAPGEAEEVEYKPASSSKKRQSKPKSKSVSLRISKPKRRESMPWIKW